MTRFDMRLRRRGTVLPFFAVVAVALFAFLALAIDVGLAAVAATECQAAADGAALVATRNLDNKPTSSNSNATAADTAGRGTVTNNVLHAAKFTGTSVGSVRFGTYDYDTAAQQFVVSYPGSPPAGRSWTATEVVVNGSQPAFFGRIFGSTGMQVGRRAVAVHRPRDVAVVMDLTGSMRFGSTLNANGSYLSADPLYPQAGHFDRYTNYAANNPNTSNTSSSTEAGRNNPFFTTTPFVAGTGELYAPNNYTVQTAGGPAAVKDFFYTPSNLSSPSTTALAVAPNMSAVSPATPLPRAFHHWEPTPSSPGDPDNYIAPVYGYGGWTGVYDPAGFVQYPTPDTFRDQSHAGYLGDRFPRKKGEEAKTANRTADWGYTTATGAAVNLAEYLGWTANVTAGSSAPTPNSTTNRPAIPSAAPGRKADWSDFRDTIWETYGYDLDVTKYITQRATYAWDPRLTVDATVRAFVALNTRRDAADRFKGYSMGPGYWGKTFMMWPPDPRWGVDATAAAGPAGDGSPDPTTISDQNPVKDATGNWIADWRRRFFLKADGTAFDPQGDNNAATTGAGNVENVNDILLTNGAGATLTGTAKINYAAVLKWVKSPPMALPPNLRAGRVLYYSSIPDDVDTSSGSTDAKTDKIFWKNYIDFVLTGTQITSTETKGWPNGATPGVFTGDLTGYVSGATTDPKPYMHYLDNPSRPRAQFWFGPISMMAYLAIGQGGNNAWAGTVHETQTWQLKAGMNSALDDIRNNHPNDAVGMTYFSHGDYKFISVALGQEWAVLKSALFYPQSLIDNGYANDPTKEFRAFDVNGNYRGASNIPNAQSGTDPNTGLAMGFNILSPNTLASIRRTSPPSPFANPSAPRSGRRGASKIVIFETDGVPNAATQLTFNAAGYNSYYTVSGGGSGYNNGDSAAMDPAYLVADQIVKPMLTTTSGDSGLSTPNSPARVYAVGFGDLFSTPSATFQPQARAFLLNLQKHGKTSGPSDTAIPASQIITGPYQTRIDSLRTCFERIMQSGVQVTLVE